VNHKLLATLFAACASAAVSSAFTNNLAQLASPPKGTSVSATAKGTFDVKAAPQPTAESDDSGIARLALDKQFHGDLEAVSKGQMLAASTATKGSAGYVAIEKVTGTLAGRKGSFALQHIGTMNRGVPSLNVSVIPDSGTDQLTGLSGKMSIEIKDGKHSYSFAYSLPDAH
jgi:hypothetical protein